ncbi:DEKNAAC104217 [Brettanomyces naardenensis]|uniref:DEKNAAC104217 n=1 Tax=Brettanomyces naardenensis TaxID=13370 RepID=A0A448YPQ5_BRENA|nr:DEKNAAC104217 [Brettanomyces naardenensis]
MQSYESSNASKDANDDKQRLLNYNSSFQNSSSSVVNPFSSSNNLPQLPNSLPPSASAYTRYPQGLTGSRVASTQSLGSKSSAQSGHSALPSSNSSDKSSSPFLVDSDFSPFGGYPASSFPLHIDEKEDDDYLHNPDPIADADYDKHRFWYDLKSLDKRSGWSLFGIVLFIVGILGVMVILPILTYTGAAGHAKLVPQSYTQLSEYVYPRLSAIRTSLIDPDTPKSAYTREALDGSLWSLVFSDEFAVDGRTFYDGDDQFWYAPDLHYDATKDLEWYDPDAVTTANGTVQFRMDAFQNHNLFYRSGMLHSWNRACFTQGTMEVSAQFPGYGNVSGMWPGLWSMGNLGRPGYMATTDGVWPYSYDSCDAGITANQSSPDGISYLGGQRLNACTCKGEDHPNRGTGRGAPEIDIIEAEVDTNVRVGVASQSLQIAPMDIWYMPDYNWIEVYNNSVTTMNTYAGGPFQEAVSATTTLNTKWYELGDGERYFQKYAFEYLNDDSAGYVRWFVGEEPTFTVHANALAPNGNIGWRRISKEPMSMVMNLGVSNNWAYIDWPSISFPTTMQVDYVRVYQPNNSVSMTCDPSDYPTYDYIQSHPLAYQVWNYTNWTAAGYDTPKNSVVNGC